MRQKRQLHARRLLSHPESGSRSRSLLEYQNVALGNKLVLLRQIKTIIVELSNHEFLRNVGTVIRELAVLHDGVIDDHQATIRLQGILEAGNKTVLHLFGRGRVDDVIERTHKDKVRRVRIQT